MACRPEHRVSGYTIDQLLIGRRCSHVKPVPEPGEAAARVRNSRYGRAG